MAADVRLPPAWAELADRWRDIDSVALTVAVDRSGEAVLPEAAVLTALDRATREAIRNAAKHAGVDTVELALELDRHRVRLTVVDHGVGFSTDPERLRAGHGLQHSIVELVGEVGGRAEIRSSPGVGTRVVLTWRESRGAGDLLRRNYDAVADVGRSVFLGVAGPMTAANLVLAVSEQVADPSVPAMWGMMLAGVGLVLWTGGRLRTPPRVRDVAVVALTVPVLTTVAILLTGPAALATMASWYVGFYSFALAIVAFVVPVRLLPLLLGPQVLLIAAVSTVTPEVGPAGFGAVNSVLLPGMIGWGLGTFLRRSSRRMQARQRELAGLLARTAAERESAELRRRHLEDAAEDIGPFLHDIGVGLLDPTAAETRAASHALAQLSRDDLYVPGYFDPQLRRLVREFRTRGGRLRIGEGVPPHAEGRPDGRLLGLLLPHLDGETEASLVLREWEPLPGRLVLTPALPQQRLREVEQSCADWGVAVEPSDYQTVFRLPMPLNGGVDE